MYPRPLSRGSPSLMRVEAFCSWVSRLHLILLLAMEALEGSAVPVFFYALLLEKRSSTNIKSI